LVEAPLHRLRGIRRDAGADQDGVVEVLFEVERMVGR
jgi:hypothetical protein